MSGQHPPGWDVLSAPPAPRPGQQQGEPVHGLTSSELLCYLESCKDPVPGAACKARGVPAPRSQSKG